MSNYRIPRKAMVIAACVFSSVFFVAARTVETTVPVQMTVTVDVMGKDKRMPEVNPEDVKVKQGMTSLKVTEWMPARGEKAGLDLFILIDDASDASLGLQLDDMRAFINAQPATTAVGVGYTQNASVQILENFTTDHAAAAKALRLPIGSTGAYSSPYLSLVDLMKRWPEHANRREVILVTDGIDRFRSVPRSRGLGFISPDVDTASSVAQRTGTIIYSIYTPGVGHVRHSFWEANNGQNSIAKLSEETGGESFFLGLQAPVSFKPYLDQLENILENQYLLTFRAEPGKKAGLQNVRLSTEVAGVEFAAADGVWVPAAK